MRRAVAILTLAASLGLGGPSVCPRSECCVISSQAGHGCCRQQAARLKADCCPRDAPASSPALAVARPNPDDHRPVKLLNTPAPQRPALSAGSLAGCPLWARGGCGPPPDTPINQHTTLLL